jgi:hypothetical protein
MPRQAASVDLPHDENSPVQPTNSHALRQASDSPVPGRKHALSTREGLHHSIAVARYSQQSAASVLFKLVANNPSFSRPPIEAAAIERHVTVTIGRLEVKAATERGSVAVTPTHRASCGQGLDNYLRARGGER